jgi:alanine racemase
VRELVRAVEGTDAVLVEGLYTHFPDADAADAGAARGQIEAFGALLAEVRAAGCRPDVVHAANSAALLNLPDSHLDMVRPGLLAYGVRINGGSGAGHAVELPEFRPVMSFRSRLVQVRELPAGATISYGRTYVTPAATRIGVVAAGYGHGLALEMSGRGQLLVRGRQVPIRGRVTMDMTMVDLSAVPEARVEDEVVIFGDSEGATIRIDEVASWCNTIPYEIMCSIGKRVPRVFRRGGETVRITTLIGDRRRRSTDDVPGAPIPAPALGRIGVAPLGGRERLG